jgi:hypothetical protein
MWETLYIWKLSSTMHDPILLFRLYGRSPCHPCFTVLAFGFIPLPKLVEGPIWYKKNHTGGLISTDTEKQKHTKVNLIASTSFSHCVASLLPPLGRLWRRLIGEGDTSPPPPSRRGWGSADPAEEPALRSTAPPTCSILDGGAHHQPVG